MRLPCVFIPLVTLMPAATFAASDAPIDQVDLRLVIAVDTGGQEDVNQSTQRNGYVAAFRSADVLAAIELCLKLGDAVD